MKEKIRNHKQEIFSVTGVLLAALAWQAYLFITGVSILDGDECYMALRGLYILDGHLPVFYYGQDYMGCIESYVFAFFRIFGGSSTPLLVKIQGAFQMLIFLASSYFLIRKMLGKRIALYALIFLAVPPNMAGTWYAKIRGYTPVLILGNFIILSLVSLREHVEDQRAFTLEIILAGFFMGLSWWANPISIFYCLFAVIIILGTPAIRKTFFSKIRRSPSSIYVNITAVLIFVILISRSITAPRRWIVLRLLFEHRTILFMVLGLIALSAIITGIVRRKKINVKPALICSGFLAGNLPMLIYYWSHESLNLKQGLGELYQLWANIKLSPMFVFPVIAGLTNIRENLNPAIFGLFPVLYVIMIYAGLLWCGVRILKKKGWPAAWFMLLGGIIMISFWAQNSSAWIQTRYLLALYLPLSVFTALFFSELDKQLKGLGAALFAVLLMIHIFGTIRLPGKEIVLPSGRYPGEKKIVNFCNERNYENVFIDESDTKAQRLSLFSEEEVIFLYPRGYFNRITRYEKLFLEKGEGALLVPEEKAEGFVSKLSSSNKIAGFYVYENVSNRKIFELYKTYFLKKPEYSDIKEEWNRNRILKPFPVEVLDQ